MQKQSRLRYAHNCKIYETARLVKLNEKSGRPMVFEGPFATHNYLTALNFVVSVAALIMEKKDR